eukprot:CAMPEP_0197680364 /NCGR_PEP_ID=MMETSP1338-20131121/93184_1 /TAXON_ID=43686 ORGANISM="Pelagodinium beii, Strain RCC1491" /NCGR_SAMPLE_ID=MMETSP1338 /ASSEMBLY_ACC=CAM_ASM_000754 /LENGTH=284 /DNA_ID=CAMNT_0043261529 /DNA_START=52 /DNA_END=902 /DNA_ORIENTATION=-
MAGAVAQVWPQEDILRLLEFLQARSLAPLVAASLSLRSRFQEPVTALRKSEADSACGAFEAWQLQEALQDLESVLVESRQVLGDGSVGGFQSAEQELQSLEVLLQTEMRYVYGPDWEVKPGKLVSRKGTWLKKTAKFSWELAEGGAQNSQKLYLPTGVSVPVLQIGKVTDPAELKLHEWAGQHMRVWLKPGIVRSIEARYGVWFLYWPHFEDRGTAIVPTVDTWLKRSTQMSGELQPFELIYVPRGLAIQLAGPPETVEEEWEKHRHQHVHLHRKVVLASPPLT